MIELDRICIDEATAADMSFIEACIQRFRLDDEHLEARQFLVFVRANKSSPSDASSLIGKYKSWAASASSRNCGVWGLG
jgi:hypothetical protein